MTRLLAVAALAALITACATPYWMHAAGGMRGMQGMHDGMPGQREGMQPMCEAASAAEAGALQR